MSVRALARPGRWIGALAVVSGVAIPAAAAGHRTMPVQYALTPGPTLPGPAPSGFWVSESGRQVGPLDEAQLRARAEAGALSSGTPVWAPGMPSWLPAGNVPALAGLLAPGAPQSVPPVGTTPAAQVDPSQLMLGTWDLRTDFDIARIGKVRLTLVARYDGDGQGTAQGTVRQGQDAFPVRIAGTWRAVPLGPDRFTFAFDGTVAIADGRGEPQPRTITDSSVVHVVDRDTLRTESGVMRRRRP